MPTESVPFPTSSTTPSNVPSTSLPGTAAAGKATADPERDAARGSDAARAGAAVADDLIGRIAQGAHQAIDRLAEGAAPRVNRLQERVAGVGDSLHQSADRARELGDEWTESLRCTVREHPLASIGVALAVGLLIARISR